ncbi:MAG: hypothetical protein ABW173_00490 [Sphingomonas sp.]
MATPDTNLSTEHQQPGDAKRPGDTLDREQTPAKPDMHKGSPAKGAHRFGSQGAKAES